MFELVKQDERKTALENAVKNGLRTISGGLGLPEGTYEFTTSDGICTGTFTTPSGWLLTAVLGSAEGKTFDETNLCVVPTQFWNNIKPSQKYEMIVNERGYVTSFLLKSSDE